MAPFFETKSQAWVFISMIYLGMALGIVYDGLSLIRKGKKAIWTIGADLLFFLLAGSALTLALVITGQGGLRFYALLGLVCGGIVYLLGIRRLVAGIAALCVKYIIKPTKEAMARTKERKERIKSLKQAGKKKKAANT